jgi:hypothetical protein
MQGSLTKDRNVFYNNVLYVDYGTSDLDFFMGSNDDINDLGAYFYNNIFYATGQGRFRMVYTKGDPMVRSFDETIKPDSPANSMFRHNCYFGPWKNGIPEDANTLVSDPKFIAPGRGGVGLFTLKGYMLCHDSPCINAGMYFPFQGGKDFFGNTVNDGHPDIGAFEFLGSEVFKGDAVQKTIDEDAADASSIAWTKWMFPKEIYIGEKPSEISIKLREAIDDDVMCLVTVMNLNTKENIKVKLSNDRNIITLKSKKDKEDLLNSRLHVSIRKGRCAEEWDIPFVGRPTHNR